MLPHEHFYQGVTRPEHVPAFAAEDAPARRVTLAHPIAPTHPNLVAAAARYRARGWRVTVAPILPAHLEPRNHAA